MGVCAAYLFVWAGSVCVEQCVFISCSSAVDIADVVEHADGEGHERGVSLTRNL